MVEIGVCAVLAIAGAAGCAGGPDGRAVPEWVVAGPPSSEDYVFFVGSGSSEEAGAARAEERARLTVVDEIVRYLGARIEVETTATVQASLDSFQEQIRQDLRQQSEARVAGLRVVDRYVQVFESRTTVYVLARYDRNALEQERRRLNSLMEERTAAVEVPEREARDAAEAGKLFTAIASHVEAAVAAADERIDNGEVKMQSNLADALRLARRITITATQRRIEAFVDYGEPPRFSVRVAAQPAGSPVPDARLSFSFPERTAGGRTVIRSRTVSTDADGLAVFTPPPPSSIGRNTVTVSLAARQLLESAEVIEDRSPAALASLRGALGDVRTQIEYRVISRAQTVATGVAVLDRDIAGNPIGSDATTRGLVQRLGDKGFAVEPVSVDQQTLLDQRASDIVEALRGREGVGVERVVVGRAQIEEFQEEDGFLVAVSGSVQAFDLDSGRLLHAVEGFARSRASSSSGAVSAAFSALGADLAERLAVSLP